MANAHTTLASLFSATANAIREKTGKSGTIKADDFPAAISNIRTGSKRYPNTGGKTFDALMGHTVLYRKGPL